MKKRLVLINSLMIFLSLAIFLIISVVTISKINNAKSSLELENYLSVATSIYSGDNEDEVIASFSETLESVRITFIDESGVVIADSSSETEFDLHNTRDEILNLGEIVIRYSDTLEQNMMYLAAYDDGNYLRVSIYENSMMSVVDNYVNISIVVIVIIVLLNVFILWPVGDGVLKPLNNISAALSKISGNNKDSIEDISSNIDKVSDIIDSQENLIKEEKEKLVQTLNHVKHGIMFIDLSGKITLVNKFLLDMYDVALTDVFNRNFIHMIRQTKIQELIDNALVNNQYGSIELEIDKLIYYVDVSQSNNKIVVLYTDVSYIKNIENVKREFFANASHELKSPLTSIIGYQQMIQQGIIEDPLEIKHATSNTIKEANRMNQIIIEMLELSKLESDLNYEVVSINLKEIVLEIVDILKPKQNEKNIITTTNLDNIYVEATYSHMFMLIKNLIDNAIKYNVDGGSINISLKNNMLKVSDSGIGIASRDISRVFERFYRVDKAKSKNLGGTGLGLAIVKHICQIYNFEISVESEITKTTTFSVKLY